jgi:hypothetical protein
MGDLSAQLPLTLGGLTQLVDRSIADGFVERERDPTDGRVRGRCSPRKGNAPAPRRRRPTRLESSASSMTA